MNDNKKFRQIVVEGFIYGAFLWSVTIIVFRILYAALHKNQLIPLLSILATPTLFIHLIGIIVYGFWNTLIRWILGDEDVIKMSLRDVFVSGALGAGCVVLSLFTMFWVSMLITRAFNISFPFCDGEVSIIIILGFYAIAMQSWLLISLPVGILGGVVGKYLMTIEKNKKIIGISLFLSTIGMIFIIQILNPQISYEKFAKLIKTKNAPVLKSIVKDKSAYFRTEAIKGLMELNALNDKETFSTLMHIATDKKEDDLVRSTVIKALGYSGNREAIPLLKSIIENENEPIYIRRDSVIALGDIGNNEVVPYLIKCIKDSNFVRQSISALGKIKDPYAVPILSEKLIDRIDKDYPILREDIVKILGEIGDKRAVPALIKELQQQAEDSIYRHTVMKTLAKIGTEEAIVALREVVGKYPKDKEILKDLSEKYGFTIFAAKKIELSEISADLRELMTEEMRSSAIIEAKNSSIIIRGTITSKEHYYPINKFIESLKPISYLQDIKLKYIETMPGKLIKFEIMCMLAEGFSF